MISRTRLLFGGDHGAHDDFGPVGYADASWADCKETRGGTRSSSRSKLQRTVSLSSTEAEYLSACEAGQEAVWQARLVRDLTGHKVGPVTIFEDNKGCRDLALSSKFHARVKHIEIRHHKLREWVQARRIKLEPIASGDQIADAFAAPGSWWRERRRAG